MASTDITITVNVEPFRRALVLFQWREWRPLHRKLIELRGGKRQPRPGWVERRRKMRQHPLMRITETGKADVLVTADDLTEDVKQFQRERLIRQSLLDAPGVLLSYDLAVKLGEMGEVKTEH